mmetsp:Transcript_39928/g.124562  ORF Transcript_39928/g.124562 Transcript_39928/m.124562 type:complete len:232 (+) Transcript_39928:30-725(+)
MLAAHRSLALARCLQLRRLAAFRERVELADPAEPEDERFVRRSFVLDFCLAALPVRRPALRLQLLLRLRLRLLLKSDSPPELLLREPLLMLQRIFLRFSFSRFRSRSRSFSLSLSLSLSFSLSLSLSRSLSFSFSRSFSFLLSLWRSLFPLFSLPFLCAPRLRSSLPGSESKPDAAAGCGCGPAAGGAVPSCGAVAVPSVSAAGGSAASSSDGDFAGGPSESRVPRCSEEA